MKPAKRKPLVAWVHVHRWRDSLFTVSTVFMDEKPTPCERVYTGGETCKGWLRFREVRT